MRRGEDTSGSRRLGAGDSSQPASCGCIAQVPHDRPPMNERAHTMRNVEQMKQGLIAGVRKRAWRARRERDRQARRWAFLAEAGQLLEDALDFDSTMERIATLAVPSVGDWAVVHVVESDGAIRRVALVHGGEAPLSVERGGEDDLPRGDAPAGPGKVI